MASIGCGAVLACCAAVLTGGGCHHERTADRRAASVAPASPTIPSAAETGPARLPEDPAAGQRAQEQWRQHLAHEERERQLGFDRRRLSEHRALVALIESARQMYERARTPAALARAGARMPARLSTIRRQVTALDHWGVNSHLLGDYAALEAALQNDYPAAKRAALQGRRAEARDAPALDAVRADFDRHMSAIAAWLDEAAANEAEDEQ